VAKAQLAHTALLSGVKADDFDAIFYAGGHGPLWDLAEDKTSIALIEAFWTSGKPVSAVCHAPGVLRHATVAGAPLAKGRKVTGFSDSEEAAVKLTDVVPFLVEDELKRLGGLYRKGPDWGSFVVVEGQLVTGQNPASSAAVAGAVIGLLRARG
jgi:putative intracellular protease/amidase